MKYISTFYFSIISLIYGYCQKGDHIWQLGSNYDFQETQDHWLDPFQFNFNKDPMELEYIIERKWDFAGTNSSICDENGNLLFYSNGMAIFDSTHQIVQGGDSINYGDLWEIFFEYLPNGEKRYGGFKLWQGNLFLPSIINKNEYLYFGSKYSSEKEYTEKLTYTKILTEENKTAHIVEKNISCLNGEMKGNIKAVRHANGRDWWILVYRDDNTKYYVLLYDEKGINLKHEISGIKELSGYSAWNATFNLDGDKFVTIASSFWKYKNLITLFDFNRTTGVLSNVKYDSLETDKEAPYLGYGVIFSPDGKYLYANWDKAVYRYNMEATDIIGSKELLAPYDGFVSWCNFDSTYCPLTYFGYWQYGPDGKLYNVSGFGGSRHMHRMNYPDEEDPGFVQHAIFTPNNPWTIPNFPNFRLGPLDGSPADTLGLDNHPIAKFRYEQDTINHLNVRFTDLSYFRPETWHWDFGDGTTFDGRKPYWHEFPKNGTYNVCLTVSNENSEHTMCRLVNIGSTSNEELKMKNEKLVSLFPNPTDGEVLLTISDYIPEEGMVYIYDMMGKLVHKQRVYYGWNNVNLIHLSNGQYMYQVFDKKNKISHGKLIKI